MCNKHSNVSSDGRVFKEGFDYHDEAEATMLMGRITRRQHTRLTCDQRLAILALRDMHFFERTGILPGGLPANAQPAVRVELWEAYWTGKESAQRSKHTIRKGDNEI